MSDFFSILSGLYVVRMIDGHGHRAEARIIVGVAIICWAIEKTKWRLK